MALSVASIAKRAYDGVAGKVAGVIHEATLIREGEPTYNPETGQYVSSEETDTGRMIFDNATPLDDAFPDFVPGPGDELAYVEGLANMAPREGDRIEAADKAFAVKKVSDLLRAGAFYPVIVRAESA